MADLSVTFCGVEFKNPLVLASGILGITASSFHNVVRHGAGGVTTKSLWLTEHKGHPNPVMIANEHYMLNAVGVPDAGIEKAKVEMAEYNKRKKAPIIANIIAGRKADYGEIAEEIAKLNPDIIEVNISCPNVENRGLVFACDPDASRRVIDGVRKTIGGELPIIAKLSPDVTNLAEIAKGVVDAGADALALINTVLGMVINLDTMKPHLGGKTGGLSGPAIRPIAVRAIYQVHAALPHVPILGMGGVATGRDALELILAGASGISVGTASFGNPTALITIQNELRDLLAARGFVTVQQAIGYAHREEPQ